MIQFAIEVKGLESLKLLAKEMKRRIDYKLAFRELWENPIRKVLNEVFPRGRAFNIHYTTTRDSLIMNFPFAISERQRRMFYDRMEKRMDEYMKETTSSPLTGIELFVPRHTREWERRIKSMEKM